MSRGAVFERCADQFAVEAHHQRCLIDFGAGPAIQHARIGGQHLHALSFQNDECGFVNRRHLIVGEHLHGLEWIAQMPVRPRAVEDGMADIGAAGSASAAPTDRVFRLFHAGAARVFWAENYYRENRRSSCRRAHEFEHCARIIFGMPLSDTPMPIRGRPTACRSRWNEPPPPRDSPFPVPPARVFR